MKKFVVSHVVVSSPLGVPKSVCLSLRTSQASSVPQAPAFDAPQPSKQEPSPAACVLENLIDQAYGFFTENPIRGSKVLNMVI